MYAHKAGDGRLRFAVENHKGYAEIILEDGIIKEAYYSDRPDHKADYMHRKCDVLRKMADISLSCFVEMFEHLSTEERSYKDAKVLLRVNSDWHNIELRKHLELQEKMNKLLE